MTHTEYKCHCHNVGCQFCYGGLFSCTVCGGFEGTLTTDCPGDNICQETLDKVYKGELDYREGRGWVKPDGTGNSMGDYKCK